MLGIFFICLDKFILLFVIISVIIIIDKIILIIIQFIGEACGIKI